MALPLWKCVAYVSTFIALFHLLLSLLLSENQSPKVSISSYVIKTSNVGDIAKMHRDLNATLTNLHQQLSHMKSNLQASTSAALSSSSSSSSMSDRIEITTPPLNVPPKHKSSLRRNSNRPKRRAAIFTMDSIESYEENSRKGGAAGEILIRKSLEYALTKHFNVDVLVVKSDNEFNTLNVQLYDFLILDPWTWAGPGWVPKQVIKGHEHKLYLLDFFGSASYRGTLHLPSIKTRVLTAFGSPWNTFLGFYLSNNVNNHIDNVVTKLDQGIIWGKDFRHYKNKLKILETAAMKSKLVSTASLQSLSQDSSHALEPYQKIKNIVWSGHQNAQGWKDLLLQSKFLLGVGDPLLGPSAIDAISLGCVYINPRYDKPVRDVFTSQHPYADLKIGFPYVCSYDINNMTQLQSCIDHALTTNLKSLIPVDFLLESYLKRVQNIFKL